MRGPHPAQVPTACGRQSSQQAYADGGGFLHIAWLARRLKACAGGLIQGHGACSSVLPTMLTRASSLLACQPLPPLGVAKPSQHGKAPASQMQKADLASSRMSHQSPQGCVEYISLQPTIQAVGEESRTRSPPAADRRAPPSGGMGLSQATRLPRSDRSRCSLDHQQFPNAWRSVRSQQTRGRSNKGGGAGPAEADLIT